MQNVARDVVVQLKLEHGRERIVVVVSWRIIDVRLGSSVAKFFAARRRRFDTLKIGNIFPPARIPLICRQIVRVDVRLSMRHHAAGEINKWNRAGQRVIEKERGLVCIEFEG